MQNQILFVTLFSILTTNILTAKVVPCGQPSKTKLDIDTRAMTVLGDPDRKYPKNDEEAKLHCEEDAKILTWGKNYTTRCLKATEEETSRHVLSLMVYATNSMTRKRCRSVSTRKVFIKAGKCGNLVEGETIKCYNKYTLEMEQLNRSKKTRITNGKHLFPLICCSYHRFYQCCSDIYTDTSYAKGCPRSASVELEAYIKESMYDVIQYLCGDYQENSDKCDKLKGQYQDVYDMRIAPRSLPKSPFGPANEIFDSI